MTAVVAFIAVDVEPVMEEREAIDLGMSVIEVVTRLDKLMGDMVGLLGEETDRDSEGLSMHVEATMLVEVVPWLLLWEYMLVVILELQVVSMRLVVIRLLFSPTQEGFSTCK